MSHAAYMRDDALFPRAAQGDGEALLALVERYGLRVQAFVAGVFGDEAATAATARAFAALATGVLPHPDGDGLARLTDAALDVPPQGERHAAGTARAAPPTSDMLLLALLAHLPEPQRAALAAAQADAARERHETSPSPTASTAPVTGGPDAPTPLLLSALPTVPPTARTARPPTPSRRRTLDRYVERRSAARWLIPLALLAVICAYWVGRGLPPENVLTPTTVASWPTLPPRATREVAQLDPIATATVILAVPAALPTPTAQYGPQSGVIATGVGAPPALVATPTEVTPAPAPAATPEAPSVPTAIALLPSAPVARAPQPTEPPLPTAPPLTRTMPTATVAPAPTTAPPSSTPTANVSPTTAQLSLKTQTLGFGVEVGPRTLVFTNPGNDPLTWRAVADSTWLDLAQTSGTLRPGETQTVAINIARGDLPTGGYSGAVQVVTNGGDGTVPVTMTISPSNTTISAFAEPTTPLGALGCAEPTTYLVSADIAGTVPPKRATVYYAVNGGPQQTQELVAQGRRYSTTLGPFSEPGSVIYSLVITEADGNVVRSASYTLTILDCPSRVRTVPVTPPTTQPFSLAPGGRNVYTFNIVAPGSLVVTIAWQGDATRLSTLLYSPQHTKLPFEQRAGIGSLTFTFPVTEADIAAGGGWALHLVNYESGTATGRLEIAFAPPSAPTPTTTPTATPSPKPLAPTPTTPAATAPPSGTPPIATPIPRAAPATRPAGGTPKP